MEIGSILLIVALLLLVGLYVSRPFFTPALADEALESEAEHRLEAERDHRLSALLAERDRVLTALSELDFDNQLGKIPAEDYPLQRQRLAQYGADVLRQIDELEAAEVPGGDGSQPAAAEASPEQAVATRSVEAGARRSNGGAVVSAAVAAPDDDLEVLLANRRRAAQEKTAGFCYQCGSPLHQSDQFCSKCGASLGGKAAVKAKK